MSYSRNKTYSTKTKLKSPTLITTKGYVLFIENGESTKRYLPSTLSTYFDVENNSTYFDIENDSEYYGTS